MLKTYCFFLFLFSFFLLWTFRYGMAWHNWVLRSHTMNSGINTWQRSKKWTFIWEKKRRKRKILTAICGSFNLNCSFETEQTRVSLYMTAISSLSTLVQKPIIKVRNFFHLLWLFVKNHNFLVYFLQVFPENGLVVKLSGSGITGKPPTTLSPTMLIVDWRCVITDYAIGSTYNRIAVRYRI